MTTSRARTTPRQKSAAGTRKRIRDAAKELFLERGYAATTITDIARTAGVAHQTVYFVFGSKPALLAEILDTEIVGDPEAVPLLDRPQVTRLAGIVDPAERLAGAVAVACDVTERLAPLYELVRSGAADDQVRELLDRHEEQRWRTLRTLVGLLEPELGPDPDDATDRLYALLSHEVYWLLVRRRGWTADRWRQHVTTQATTQLLRT